MSDIPDDIKATAEAIFERGFSICDDHIPPNNVAVLIASALMDERARCIAVAKYAIADLGGEHADAVAAAIRGN